MVFERITWPADPLLLGGVAAALAAGGALWLALRQPRSDTVRDRLARATGAVEPDVPRAPSITRSREGQSAGARLLRALSRLARPDREEEVSQLRARLDHAGVRGDYAMETFLGAKLGLSLLLAGVLLGVSALLLRPIPHRAALAVVLAAVGFYAPNVWLSGRIKERQKLLGRALPDALDLIVTCVEAGLSVEAALARVVDEIALGAPLLSRELSQTMLEIRTGLSRGEAFRRLGARTGLEDLKALAAMLIQTELFGTSIARALRIHSEGMRIQRTQRAEERAATVATKMLLPLILCILPSLFTVIMGPAVVRIIRQLLPMLKGS